MGRRAEIDGGHMFWGGGQIENRSRQARAHLAPLFQLSGVGGPWRSYTATIVICVYPNFAQFTCQKWEAGRAPERDAKHKMRTNNSLLLSSISGKNKASRLELTAVSSPCSGTL